MRVTKRRGATKRLGPICLGRNFVSFHMGHCNRHFSAHEDVLCKSSKYFKRLLQKDRKDIDDDCSICHETLDPEVSDLTFCRSYCGQNFHEQCIEDWKRSTRAEMACPTCRRTWTASPKNIVLPLEFGDLDPLALQSYVDWLYTGQLYVGKVSNCVDSNYNLQLLKAWIVSVRFDDDRFKNAIIAEYTASTEDGSNDGFDLDCIKYAFETHDFGRMREFVVDKWLTDKDVDYIKSEIEDLPIRFVHRLCLSALTRLKECDERKRLLDKPTKREHELQTDSDDGESAVLESYTDTEGESDISQFEPGADNGDATASDTDVDIDDGESAV